jgi:hypothetical protein
MRHFKKTEGILCSVSVPLNALRIFLEVFKGDGRGGELETSGSLSLSLSHLHVMLYWVVLHVNALDSGLLVHALDAYA